MRSGYSNELDNWDLIRWRGQVASATRGKRGQALLRDLLMALDAMPEKALIANDLENEDGDVCALGAAGKLRGVDLSKLDPEEYEAVAAAFNIAAPLAREIVYENDEGGWRETSEQRWQRMHNWVSSQIVNRPQEAAE